MKKIISERRRVGRGSVGEKNDFYRNYRRFHLLRSGRTAFGFGYRAYRTALQGDFFKKIQQKAFYLSAVYLGYAVYAAVKNLSLAYLVTEYVSVMEHGISVGAAATLLYVLYEQFVREKKQGLSPAEGVIYTLIERYVPVKRVEAVAKLIAEAIERDVTGNGAEKTAKILTENAEEGATEQDIQLLAKLIIESLAHLNAV